jgi:hypothetical protein
MTSNIVPIRDTNISYAWARAFLRVRQHPGRKLNHLIVSVDVPTSETDLEDPMIRTKLDLVLNASKKVATVANTIFPQSLWNSRQPRSVLYRRYMDVMPRLKHCPANRQGTYFHRLVAYDNSPATPVNQLEQIIARWNRGNHRHSALQISLFDPRKDHTNSPYLGFPCLQQISFTAHGTNGVEGLSITGFYATQYVLTKAYGNYVGLCRLGRFVAHELNLKFIGMTCIASLAQIGFDKEIDNSAVAKLDKDLMQYLTLKKVNLSES